MKKILYLLILLLVFHNTDAQTFAVLHDTDNYALCGYTSFTVTTTAVTTGLKVIADYGDGYRDTTNVTSIWGGGAASGHVYALSGAYTVKLTLLLGSLHLDSLMYTAHALVCKTLEIYGYKDINSNCLKEYSEPFIQTPAKVEIDSAGVPVDTISFIGHLFYTSYGPPGTIYAFRSISPPTDMVLTCPVGGVIYDTLVSAAHNYSKGFAYQCSGSTNFDLAVRSSIRANHFLKTQIYAWNNYCTPEAATLTMTFNTHYVYSVAPTPAPTSVVGNVITWNLAALTNTNQQYIDLWLYPTTALVNGEVISNTFSITPITGDVDPTNNTYTEIDTVDLSHDPNSKEVNPSGGIVPGTKLTYTINFENTGRDTAYDIRIMDTLSDNLDLNTLTILGSSATMNTLLLHTGGYNIIKFDFPNIKLPDSSHHFLCDGSVTYSINAKNGLPVGANIDNRAGIYFDGNPVVLTNYTRNTIGLPLSTEPLSKSGNARIYPNPVYNELNISTLTNNYQVLTISNIWGQELINMPVTQPEFKINVQSLPAGVYYLRLVAKENVEVLKFVKQ